MFLIVGLGNPGKQYEDTRHNVGFKVLDSLAEELDTSISKVKFKGLLGEAFFRGDKVLLLKPHTYMNLSGQSVLDAVNFYKISSGKGLGDLRRYGPSGGEPADLPRRWHRWP